MDLIFHVNTLLKATNLTAEEKRFAATRLLQKIIAKSPVGEDIAVTIQVLIQLGADPNLRLSYHKNYLTPLMVAVQKGTDPVIVELLLNLGADPNIADIRNITPLMQAVINNQVRELGSSSTEIVTILLRHGADISLRNNDNQTATDIASQYGFAHLTHIIEGSVAVYSLKDICISYLRDHPKIGRDKINLLPEDLRKNFTVTEKEESK